jgi:2-dehydropantoate 2-reductase
MLQDILNRKQTEIDMINGAIVREGAALGIAAPVNQVLTNLIKFIQKTQ